jgi:aspartokinase-like uncharacterized kinase
MRQLTMSRRILVCGGRGFTDRDFVQKTLSALHAEELISEVIHGGSSFADYEAWNWARTMRIKLAIVAFSADDAGHNQRKLEGSPDLVVAFPGGEKTADMVRRAREAGIAVMEVKPPEA